MFGLGMQELIIILLIVVVVFGASRLPQIGDGVGKMINNFRSSVKDKEKAQMQSQAGSKKQGKGKEKKKAS